MGALANGIRRVAVIGAGIMGAGIAQVCATTGYDTVLVDTSWEALTKARGRIEEGLQIVSRSFPADKKAAFVKDTMARLTFLTSTADAVRHADLVIEAIVEHLDTKRKLFRIVEENVSSNAILATNTSSLKLRDIGSELKRKEKFGGLHFFNPVPKMSVVEVIRTDHTSEETFQKLLAFTRSIDKKPIICKDTIGFVVNRILIPLQNTALGLVDRGVATPKDIDDACLEALGFPIGPFALMDFVGLDLAQFIMDGWREHYSDEIQIDHSPTLAKLVAAGKLGRKSGEGFYKYKSKI
ncbi:Hydroxyacyl-coenzyme A dehydrogenase [Aphelenchoides avenae]|nr:Hydroxyacyl-coenzyme A dehydrogenase [Aphelenchus avenae]